jgi:hypothetical protein
MLKLLKQTIMETKKSTPVKFKFMLPVLGMALGMSLLAGCRPDEEADPMPASATDVSNAVTRSFEDMTIYRMEMRIHTTNVEDAGTDNGVYVQLHDRDKRFYLNKSTDDFVRGHVDYYDVMSESVKKVRDIGFLKFGLRGDDGVSLKKIEIYLNGNRYPVYVKEYGSQGRWLDNSQSFTIPGYELRAFSGWRFTPQHSQMDNPPTAISRQMMLSLVENAIGNQLNYMDGFDWGSKVWGLPNTLFGPAVEMTYVDNQTLHFDLDLQRKLGGPNPEIDVDFDLTFKCENGIIHTELKNLKVETNWVGEVQKWIRQKGSELIGLAIGSYVGQPVPGTVAGGLLAKYLSFDIKIDLQNPNVSSSCKTIDVSSNGDIGLR